MSASIIRLEDWLSTLKLGKLRGAFKEIGVTAPHDLALLNDTELGAMLEAMKLKTMERIKLTIAIRKLETTKSRLSVITPEEDKAMKQLNVTATQARDILTKVQATMAVAEQTSSKVKHDIIEAFKPLHKALHEREKQLLSTLNKEASYKMNKLNTQSMQISTILAQCAQAERNCNKLLTVLDVHSLTTRESDIKQATNDALNAKIDTNPAVNPEIELLFDQTPFDKIVSALGFIFLPPELPTITVTQADPKTYSLKVDWKEQIPNLEHVYDAFVKRGNILKYCVKFSDDESKVAEGEVGGAKEVICEVKQCHTTAQLKPEHKYNVQIKAMYGVNKRWGDFGPSKTVMTGKQGKADDLHINGTQLRRLSSNDGQFRMFVFETLYEKGKHSFGVKVVRSASSYMYIGIAPAYTYISPIENKSHDDYPNSYGYCVSNGSVHYNGNYKSGGTAGKAGDVISVSVDVDKKTLQFALNGKKFPVFDIDMSGPVSPAVALRNNGDEVSFMEQITF